MQVSQNSLLLQNLLKFYTNSENLQKILRIVNGETKLSLRIVDWFVTNYSKKYFIVYRVPTDAQSSPGGGIFYVTTTTTTTTTTTAPTPTPSEVFRRFNVYNDYKLKLRAFSKRNFDPFCRWVRIKIPYLSDTQAAAADDALQEITTTIGQLNFFKWAITNRILEYIEENYEEIESDMNQRNTLSKKNNNTSNSNNDLAPKAPPNTPLVPPSSQIVSSSNKTSVRKQTDDSSMAAAGTTTTAATTAAGGKTRKKREELSVSACKSVKKENVDIIVRFI